MIRHAATILSLALLPACASTAASHEDAEKREVVRHTLGLTEVRQTAETMKTKLASFHFPDQDTNPTDGRVRLRVPEILNDTRVRFDVKTLSDEIREVMQTSSKIVLASERELSTDFNYRMEPGTAVYDGHHQPTPAEHIARFGRYALDGHLKPIAKKSADAEPSDYRFTLDLVEVETEKVLLTAERVIRTVEK